MENNKRTPLIVILCILVLFAGIGVGIFAGKTLHRTTESFQTENKITATPVPDNQHGTEQKTTDIPDAGGASMPVETPGLTQAAASDVTGIPDETIPPNPTEILLPSVTSAVEITEKPGATPVPEPTITQIPGGEATPVPTLVPTPAGEATPVPTLVPTPAGKATPAPTTAPKATATPKPQATAVPTKIPEADTRQRYFGALHVKGTKLVDQNGTPVVLRGISSHGLGWFPEYINDAAIRQFAEEWGCNVIRLAMYTAEYNGYCTSNDAQKENLKRIVDTGVKAATANDMYVIIDWHILSDGNPNQNKSEALKFFDEMSKKYADNPHVLYEICNEPNGGTSWKDVKKYALEVIPVIRKNAPDAVIIVGSPTWSQDVDLAADDPITSYDNIAYSLHFYAATHKQSLRDKAKKAISKGLCLLVTEYGVCDASGNGALDLKEANTWIDFLNRNDIGYIAWNLSNKAETSSMIKASCNKVNGFTKSDMTEGGLWFLDMLKKEAGGLGTEGSGTTAAGEVTKPEQSGSGEAGPAEKPGEGSNTGNQGKDYKVYEEKYFEPQKGIKAVVTNGWESGSNAGIQLTITIENTTGQAETNWVRTITVKHADRVKLTNAWNVTAEYKNGVITLKPVGHNATIPAGGSIGDIGMILEIETE